jgi:hypothetical protein
LLTPFFLGTVVGAVVTGRVHDAGDPVTSWANPASLLTGALFVAVSAYLAAVYLTVDSERDGEPDMRSYFIRRALAAAVASGGLAAVTLAVLHTTARPVFAELPGRTSWTAEVISHHRSGYGRPGDQRFRWLEVVRALLRRGPRHGPVSRPGFQASWARASTSRTGARPARKTAQAPHRDGHRRPGRRHRHRRGHHRGRHARQLAHHGLRADRQHAG